MKKRIIRTLVTMGLAVSVIMPGAQVFAQDYTTAEFTYTGSKDSDYKGQSTERQPIKSNKKPPLSRGQNRHKLTDWSSRSY